MDTNTHPLDESVPRFIPDLSIDAFKTRILYEGMPASMLGTLALVIILSSSHWNIIGHGSLIFWTIAICCIVAVRTASWYFWRQNIYMFSTSTWLTIFRAGAWISGAAWGSTAFLMFANYNPSYQALLAYTIAGVSSGSFSTLAIDKHAAVGFVGLAIFPLTIRLFMEHGPITVPMGIMSLIYLAFVLLASSRARRNLEQEHEKNSQLLAWSKERVEQQKLNKAISQAKTQFIKDADISNIFLSLLEETLELTDSRFGFIGEVVHYANKHTELHLHAICNFSNDQQLTQFYEKRDKLTATFAPANIPFGVTILNGKPIISNNPTKDVRGGGLPSGHPPLSAFLGIPIFLGPNQVAVLCIAEKPKGYDEKLLEMVRPIIATIAQFFEAILHSRQQKLYEEKLQNSAKHTQAILDEVFDAIITIDSQGNIKSFNHAAEMIFGYRAHEIINTNITHLIPQAKHLQEGGNLKQAYRMLDGQEQIGIRRNGKEFPINLATSEIISEGEPLIIGVVRDMSESKRNEELKNQFISTLGHELRTPLTSIIGALGILNSNAADVAQDDNKNLIAIALQNSKRLQDLINDLMDMDKLIANKMEMTIIPHCIAELVEEAVTANREQAEKYQVKFQFNKPPEKVLIYGDASRLHQVLSNLLVNSAKFSQPDGIVDIQIAPAGKFARVIITDYGRTISEDFKTKLFQRFTQTDPIDTDQQDEIGLGLAISKELIQKMGGNMGFISNGTAGGSFFIEVPLVDNNIQY